MTSTLPIPHINNTTNFGRPSEWTDMSTSTTGNESTGYPSHSKDFGAERPPVMTTSNTASGISTPGREFPGSYPAEFDMHQQQNGTSGDQSSNMVESAKQSVPSPSSVGESLQGLKGKMTSYWSSNGSEPQQQSEPQSVLAWEPKYVSLPSTEHEGTYPSEKQSGAGKLPGSLDESAIAVLPDERIQQQTETNPFRGGSTTGSGPRAQAAEQQPKSGAKTAGIAQERPDDIPLDGAPIPYPATSDPQANTLDGVLATGRKAQEDRQSAAKTAGVAQGRPDDIPLEGAPRPYTTPAQSTNDHFGLEDDNLRGAELASGGGLHPKKSESGVNAQAKDKVPQADEEKVFQNRKEHKEDVEKGKTAAATSGDSKPGYGENYHPADINPPPAQNDKHEEHADQHHDVDSVENETESTDANTGKKAGFMAKVKGQTKIVTGKVMRNEEKVEEGKKIKAGEL